MSTKTKQITESAMLLAVAIVLELISKSFIPEMPFGGQLTIVSMLPVVLISYRHGMKWGLVACLTYACLEMALGAKTVAGAFQPGTFGDGVMIGNALIMCLLDYILAYTALCLGGIFRSGKKQEANAPEVSRPVNHGLAFAGGSLVALGARYLCHFASGYILYNSWAEWYFTQEGFPAWGQRLVESVSPQVLAALYSLVYNGTYMIPEMILTAVAAVAISRIPKIVIKVS